MSFTFKPYTDEELDTYDLIPDGEYNFEVAKSVRKVSEARNPMARLEIRFWDNENRIHFVWDNLIFSDIKLNIKKVSHFCKSVGLVEQYKKGELPEDFRGYSGKLLLGTEEESIGKNGRKYPRRNTVIDYIYTEESLNKKPNTTAPNSVPGFEDDIPF